MNRWTDEEMLERLQAQLAREKDAMENTIGAQMMPEIQACRWTAGEIDFMYMPRPWMANLRGAVHGGALATMFDHAFGLTARAACLPGQSASTLNLQMNYLSGAPADKPLLLRVRVDRMGGTLKFLSGVLFDPQRMDRPLTTASAAYTSQ